MLSIRGGCPEYIIRGKSVRSKYTDFKNAGSVALKTSLMQSILSNTGKANHNKSLCLGPSRHLKVLRKKGSNSIGRFQSTSSILADVVVTCEMLRMTWNPAQDCL